MTLPELDTTLQARGYTPGLPRRSGLIDGPALDAQIAATSTCAACGHVGLDFFPYVGSDQREWVALMRCPQCEEAMEF